MNKEFIEELITELSYRLLNGTPDLTNENHLIVLRQIMEEKGLSYDLIEKTMNNLRTPVKKNPNTTDPIAIAVDFDGEHSVQAEPQPYINPHQPQDKADQDKLPMDDRDDEERDTPVKEIKTYVFIADKKEVVETGDQILKSDVIEESKFKCFMTGEVFFETKNGTLVKELDYLDNEETNDSEKEIGEKSKEK